MRAFVAVEVPGAAPRRADETSTAPAHLTLSFLGDVEESTARAGLDALRPAVAVRSPFAFTLEGIGAFPSPESPRVVWRGVTRGGDELRGLADVVRAALVAAGIPDDPVPFVPHVTLFRVRSPRDRERASRLFGPGAEVSPAVEVPVSSVVWVESRLTPSGPIHRTVARFPLSGPPH